MNKKGQIDVILIVFIAILVGVPLFLSVSQLIGTSTNTVNVVNESLGAVSNSTYAYLTNYRSISNVVVYNATTQIVNANNYTVTNNVVNNGAEAVRFIAINTTGYTGAGGVGYTWYISGTAEPLGYVGGAGRSIALLIPVFFALIIAVVALTPSLRNGVLDMID